MYPTKWAWGDFVIYFQSGDSKNDKKHTKFFEITPIFVFYDAKSGTCQQKICKKNVLVRRIS